MLKRCLIKGEEQCRRNTLIDCVLGHVYKEQRQHAEERGQCSAYRSWSQLLDDGNSLWKEEPLGSEEVNLEVVPGIRGLRCLTKHAG